MRAEGNWTGANAAILEQVHVGKLSLFLRATKKRKKEKNKEGNTRGLKGTARRSDEERSATKVNMHA